MTEPTRGGWFLMPFATSTSPTPTGRVEPLATPITPAQIGDRAYNALRHAGISTVVEVQSRTDAQLLEIRAFGRVSLRRVRAAYGVHTQAGRTGR